MPPKKTPAPSIDSIFTNSKKSPAGAINIPIPEKLPKIQINKEIIEDEIKKASSPKPPQDINFTIKEKISKKYNDFEQIIKAKGCTVDGKYLFSNKDDQNQIYYIKVIDLNGTPFYIDMENFPKDIEVSSEIFIGSMIIIKDAKLDLNSVKYLIASNKKEDQILECGDDTFCVVKNSDDGTNKVDIFQIPKIDELENLAKDIEATQTQKSENSLNLEKDTVISYRIIKYDFFNRIEAKKLYDDNLDYYNNQIRDSFGIFKVKMANVENSYNDLGIIINSFKNNNEVAIKRSEDLKSVLLKSSANQNTRRDNLKKVNETLESYIKITNKYNKEFVNIQRIFNSIVEINNNIVDNYYVIRDLKNS